MRPSYSMYLRLRRLLGTRGTAAARQVYRRFQDRLNHRYDQARFRRHSTALRGPFDSEGLASLITIDYHRVEKGLALPVPRHGFGREVVGRLVDLSQLYESRHGAGDAVEAARGALSEYIAKDHLGDGDPLRRKVEGFLADQRRPTATVEMTRDALAKATSVDFETFLRARRSIRNFTGAPVAAETISRAVALAQESPSVCNRQSGRVHAILEPSAMKQALSFQNGNRGFGDLAGAVLIVTSDLRCFSKPSERNQAYVDGGLFAMTLVYALHAEGLGTCMLNWSVDENVDRDMRRAVAIPDEETVITYLAVGHVPESFAVAGSPRRATDDVLTFIRPSPAA